MQSASNSSISEYDLSAVDGHITSLAGQIANLGASVRNAIKV